MNYKIVLFIIMNAAFWGYVIPMTIKYGIPASISQTYYSLKGAGKVLFTISMWGFAFPTIILGVEQSGLAFLAGAGIMAVGASPIFISQEGGHTMEGKIHRIGALTAIVSSQIMIMLTDLVAITAAWFIICAVALLPKFKKKSIFIIEIASFLAVLIFYLIRTR